MLEITIMKKIYDLREERIRERFKFEKNYKIAPTETIKKF
jgi:hypothetical protein